VIQVARSVAGAHRIVFVPQLELRRHLADVAVRADGEDDVRVDLGRAAVGDGEARRRLADVVDAHALRPRQGPDLRKDLAGCATPSLSLSDRRRDCHGRAAAPALSFPRSSMGEDSMCDPEPTRSWPCRWFKSSPRNHRKCALQDNNGRNHS